MYMYIHMQATLRDLFKVRPETQPIQTEQSHDSSPVQLTEDQNIEDVNLLQYVILYIAYSEV